MYIFLDLKNDMSVGLMVLFLWTRKRFAGFNVFCQRWLSCAAEFLVSLTAYLFGVKTLLSFFPQFFFCFSMLLKHLKLPFFNTVCAINFVCKKEKRKKKLFANSNLRTSNRDDREKSAWNLHDFLLSKLLKNIKLTKTTHKKLRWLEPILTDRK